MASAFAANRDIKIEASETATGLFTLRTRGLEGKRRPELELAGIPQAALNGAGGVINMIADYSVNKAEVAAEQTVGNVLAVGDSGRKLLLAVRAVEVEKPKAGLWSKMVGGGKGVLRLVDVTGTGEAPLTAVATMLVHRAAVRIAKDDDGGEDGARAELDAAIAAFPGTPGAGKAPQIDGVSGTYNWQNHLAYLDLANLCAGDVTTAGGHFGDALARSEELARSEIGATYEAVAALGDEDFARAAERIVGLHLEDAHRGAGPSAQLIMIASPIWELDDEGRSVRRLDVLPAELASLYYEGAAAERLRRDGAALVRKVFPSDPAARWRAAFVARASRQRWLGDDASNEDGPPFLPVIGAAHPADGIVSSVLADIARCARAGGSDDEILARYAGTGAPALDEKLAELSMFETEQYAAAL
jgi:hypothetical protein